MKKSVKRTIQVLGFLLIGTAIAGGVAFYNSLRVQSAGWYNSNWLNRQKITIASSITSTNLSNFPIMVGVTTTNDIFTDALASGNDILFTDSNGTTLLDYEIERFDKASTTLIAWVQVPTVSSAAATEIYMYYNNSSASSNATSTGVWEGYEMVYHFAEDPGTSTTYTFREGENGYTGAEDLVIASGTATTNQNAQTTIQVDGATCSVGTGTCRSLMQWDISTIPAACSVTAASITINVTNAIADGDRYAVYGVRRNWGETTATWNTYDGTNNWSTAGVDNTTNDRYSTDLVNGNSDGGWGHASAGSRTHDFDSDGLALIQDWIDGDITNNGIVFVNEANDDDSYQWSDKTNATVGNRPRLSITCTVGTSYLDQTANNHDVSTQALTSTSTSPAWRGPVFDGTTANYIVIPNSGWSSANYTIEAIFYRHTGGVTATCGAGCTTDIYPIITKGRGEGDATGVDTQWQLGTSDADDFTAISFEESAAGDGYTDKNATASSDNIWYYAAATADASNNLLESWLNGSSNDATSVAADASVSQGNPVCIGAACTSAGSSGILGSWKGFIDEVRISHTVRSDDWIIASYRSIFGGGTYFTYGAEETEGPPPAVPTRIKGGTRLKPGVRIK